ncbi:kinase-like domain-containing protein [Podospora conica]|nr:kinase-like domain-containing protein [Schizothecium conicum]
MASKSRWANDDEDAQLEAQRKREKEEKKRAKAEKARQLEEQKQAAAAAAASQQRKPQTDDDEDSTARPPSKRRRLSPERETQTPDITTKPKLLRFEGGTFGKCRSVENYDKLNDIEEGAYGWVARAKERATGKVVALKRLKIDPKDRSGLPVTGLREIQILKDCNHRNIVQLLEVVVGADTTKIENIFLVLEFLEHDLKSLLTTLPHPFLASEVKTLLLQLASGLSHLHSHYILHRDLKTSNLLLSNRGRLKIADFGMARYVPSPPPQNLTSLVVTLWYRAPELLLGAPSYSSPVDLWSVGCIFGELLSATGDPLLQGKNEVDQLALVFDLCGIPTEESWPGFRRLPNARGLRLPPASGNTIRARFPTLTAAGVELLAGLLALDPERRPTAREVLAHEYFRQDPRPKQEAMFPTYPSKAGQERRRRRETPPPPTRGRAVELGAVDFRGIFAGREKEEKGGGFSLRMV